MKFIHIGDLHLGATPEQKRGWGEERKQDIKQSLQNVIQMANEKQVDFMFFSGDVFHTSPTKNDLQMLDHMLLKLKGTKVFLIAGNHDYIEKDSPYYSYEFQSNTHMFLEEQTQCVYDTNTNTYIYGQSYHRQMIKSADLDGIKPQNKEGYHILLAHGGDANHLPFDMEKLKWSGFDYIALGHIHEPRILVEDLMCYGGSLEPLDETETGKHGIFFGEFTREKQIVTFYPISQKSYVDLNIVVTPDMTEDDIYTQVRDDIHAYGEMQMYTIVLEGEKADDMELDFDLIRHEFYLVDIVDETSEITSVDALYQANKDNIIGLVIDKLRDEEDALRYALEGLLHD